MIKVNNAKLYTLDEISKILFKTSFDLAENEQINIFISDNTGDICSILIMTKKEILTHDIIIIGDEICPSHLVMFSIDKDEDNYISIDGIKELLSGYGYSKKENYFCIDCYKNIVNK